MARRISVLIADDHPVLRRGLADILRGEPTLEVVAEAGDGDAALRECEAQKPAVAILDIKMPRQTGFEVAKQIQTRLLSTSVLLITAYKDREMFEEGLRLAVRGFVLKEGAVEEILTATKVVAGGGHYLSPMLAEFVFEHRRRLDGFRNENPGVERLTGTERLVLRWIAQDRTSKEIAVEMNLSPRTVDNHRAHIAQKLDLHGTHSLLKFAYDHRSSLSSS